MQLEVLDRPESGFLAPADAPVARQYAPAAGNELIDAVRGPAFSAELAPLPLENVQRGAVPVGGVGPPERSESGRRRVRDPVGQPPDAGEAMVRAVRALASGSAASAKKPSTRRDT